jgi:hypothetical protein
MASWRAVYNACDRYPTSELVVDRRGLVPAWKTEQPNTRPLGLNPAALESRNSLVDRSQTNGPFANAESGLTPRKPIHHSDLTPALAPGNVNSNWVGGSFDPAEFDPANANALLIDEQGFWPTAS